MLVDTSVWIDHLRHGNPGLASLLEAGDVRCHPFVLGEIACGNLGNRERILGLVAALPALDPVEQEEALAFLEANSLMGRGLGWIDVHLLAAARLANVPIWTLDRRLAAAARSVGLAAAR